jgi:flagellar hook-associated protein 1 FlgK
MTGTFGSFNIALSALRYNRTAMDIAGSNTANATTTGYTRRQVVAQSTGAPALPAIWSRWEGGGSGVEAGTVMRMVDPVLDGRSRTETGTLSFLDTRSSSLSRLETAIGEPGDDGVAAALSAFKSGWQAVANNPANTASRTQLLARAETLRSTIATQATSVANEWSDQRTRLDSLSAETNQVSTELAALNHTLQAADLNGTDANDLLDHRDQLTAKLAALTGATTRVNADTTVTVTLGGQDLVRGVTAATLAVSGATSLADASTDPVTLSLDGNPVTLTSGQLGGTQQLVDTDLPDYRDRLDAFVTSFVGAVNSQHADGLDQDGLTGGDLFTGTSATTLQVAVTDPRRLAAASADKGGTDNTNATALSTLDLGADTYRQLVTGFGITVSSANQATTSQTAMVTQIDAARESVSGINTDEEMVNLLAAQRGYEGAARVLTAVDSMLDTLINRTGVN